MINSEDAIVAAVVERPFNRQEIVSDLSAETGIAKDKIHLLPQQALTDEPEAPDFRHLNTKTGSQAFFVSVIVAAVGMCLVVLYHTLIGASDPTRGVRLVIGMGVSVLVAILSGVAVASGIPRRGGIERIFDDLGDGDTLIAANCDSQDQARKVITRLEELNLNRIKVFSPDAVYK